MKTVGGFCWGGNRYKSQCDAPKKLYQPKRERFGEVNCSLFQWNKDLKGGYKYEQDKMFSVLASFSSDDSAEWNIIATAC